MDSISGRTLISPAALEAGLDSPDLVVIDCRFSLDDPARGRRDYAQAHIPGAIYAHLDEDLSAPIVRGVTGRHPLPAIDRFAARLSAWGVGAGVSVVAYDDRTGAIAARLWWMLRWLGHDDVAVLDGGWARWRDEGRPIATIAARPARADRADPTFVPSPRPELVATTVEVMALRPDPADPSHRLLDARTADRFRGENETIDPIAGHIPGAISAPFPDNLDAVGRFLPPAALRARFEHLLGGVPAERTIVYCGSGVTAAHDLLALAHAGLGDARLYAGSWSEWITDPARPVAIGPVGE